MRLIAGRGADSEGRGGGMEGRNQGSQTATWVRRSKEEGAGRGDVGDGLVGEE
jgi:hypothetical protein